MAAFETPLYCDCGCGTVLEPTSAARAAINSGAKFVTVAAQLGVTPARAATIVRSPPGYARWHNPYYVNTGPLTAEKARAKARELQAIANAARDSARVAWQQYLRILDNEETGRVAER